MQVFLSAIDMHNFEMQCRREKKTIAFVPTMGCLHEGHASLIQKARQLADVVVVSIFVNPTQFGPKEDFERYPRTLDADLALCKTSMATAVFCPKVTDIFPPGFQTFVNGGPMSERYCGQSRPGHFGGVLTVVNVLFGIVKPHVACFGEKDFQQLVLIKQMVRDLWLDIHIEACPTVRESDGLALSSRNQYFLEPARRKANCLFEALCEAQKQAHKGILEGNLLSVQTKLFLEQSKGVFKVDYAAFVHEDTLEEQDIIVVGKTRFILAAHINNEHLAPVRLIDNIAI